MAYAFAIAGTLAALLAHRGFTGTDGIFEGARGLVGVMASGADIGEATKDLGKRWELLQTGLTFCLRSGQSWVYRRRARA